MLLLLLKAHAAGPDRLELQAILTDHHGNHDKAESSEQPYHPENGLPSLGRFHGGASPFKRAVMSDHWKGTNRPPFKTVGQTR